MYIITVIIVIIIIIIIIMLLGITYERDTRPIVLHVCEIKCYNAKCVLVFEILTLRYH